MSNTNGIDFKFYLNRQGPAGGLGPKGPQGFSPIIKVSEDVEASYKLKITTEATTFETPNLKGPKGDAGEIDPTKPIKLYDVDHPDDAYIEVNQFKGSIDVMKGSPVFYTSKNNTDILSGEVNVGKDGNSTTNVYGKLKVGGEEVALETNLLSEISTREQRDTEIENALHDETSDRVSDVSSLQTQINNLPTKQDVQNVKDEVDKKQNKLIAGKNISITTNPDMTQTISAAGGSGGEILPATSTRLGGVKIGNGVNVTEDGTISVSGGTPPTNMVTTDTEQTISNTKIFDWDQKFNHKIILTNSGATNKGQVNLNSDGDLYLTSSISSSDASSMKLGQNGDWGIGGADKKLRSVGGNSLEFVTPEKTYNLLAGESSLEPATATKLGGIKVGNNLTITSDGTLSATGGSTPTNMVTTDTEQTISSSKSFTGGLTIKSDTTNDHTFIIEDITNSGKNLTGTQVFNIKNAQNSKILEVEYDSDTNGNVTKTELLFGKNDASGALVLRPYGATSKLTVKKNSLVFTNNDGSSVDLLNPTNLVTINTAQTITGKKTFTASPYATERILLRTTTSHSLGDLWFVSNVNGWPYASIGTDSTGFFINSDPTSGGSYQNKLYIGANTLKFKAQKGVTYDLLNPTVDTSGLVKAADTGSYRWYDDTQLPLGFKASSKPVYQHQTDEGYETVEMLSQADVEAGTGITVEKTTSGVKVSTNITYDADSGTLIIG